MINLHLGRNLSHVSDFVLLHNLRILKDYTKGFLIPIVYVVCIESNKESDKIEKENSIVSIWILFIFILKQNHLLSLDMGMLMQFISGNTKYAMLLFVAPWAIRLLIFIPGVTLMILGGKCFDRNVGFSLSMVSMVLSETLVYIFSKIFFAEKSYSI